MAEEALIETLIGGAGGLEVISYGEELEATSKETRGREVSGGGVVANMATQAKVTVGDLGKDFPH